MKELNNQQLVLLCVLVSFVTSTATGIFTVALLSEGPQSVTSTINRVVERTVQVVTQPAVERVIKEEKVVEQASQLVQEVVKKGTPSIVTLAVKKNETGSNEETAQSNEFIRKGTGVIINASGKVLTLSSIVDEKVSYYLVNETATTSASKLIPLSLEKNDATAGLALFKASSPSSDIYQAMGISKKALSIGQTAVVWGSQGVSVSFISSVTEGRAGPLFRVYTDSPDPLPGRIVSNIDGDLIGILRSDNTLISASSIEAFLPKEATALGT